MDGIPSDTQRRLRHVIVGVGANVFSGHRPAYDLDTVEVAAVADLNQEIGRQRATELDCPFYVDYRQMLAATQPEITVVMTPHPYHARIAIDALNAGSHVLVEKPIAVHVGEADAMIAAAQANQRILALNFQQRHRPEIVAASQLIQRGDLGQIQRVELVEPWLRTAAYYRAAGWRGTWSGEGGGVIMNQAPHGLDLVCHLAGMPSRLVAWTRTLGHAIETEDTVLAMLEWPNGAMGTLFFSTVEAGPRRMEIVGTGGRLQLTESQFTCQRFEPNLLDHIANHPGLFDPPQLLPVSVHLPEGKGDHTAVYRDLHRAILEGTPVRADGREGRMSLEVANGIIYSGHTATEVDLPLDRAAYVALLERLRAGAGSRT